MDLSELEKLAYKGDDIPKSLNAPEQVYFLGLSHLYSRFKANQITKEQAEQSKKLLLTEFNKYSAIFAASIKNNSDWTNYINQSETLRSQINKSTDIHEIAKYAIECISLMTGDETFNDNLKKLGSEE